MPKHSSCMTAICLENYERTFIKRSFWLCLDEAIGFALVLEEPSNIEKGSSCCFISGVDPGGLHSEDVDRIICFNCRTRAVCSSGSYFWSCSKMSTCQCGTKHIVLPFCASGTT
jgi:hypothetical protein